jgi:hypothetical protein
MRTLPACVSRRRIPAISNWRLLLASSTMIRRHFLITTADASIHSGGGSEFFMDLSSRGSRSPEWPQARADQAAGRPGKSRRLALALKRFVDHPLTKLVVGLILIASGLIEAYDTVLDDLHRLRVRVGHGVVILGIVNVLASLPEVIEGIERWLSYLDGRADSRQSGDGSDGDSNAKR